MLTKKIKIIFSALIVFSLAAVYGLANRAQLHESILPGQQTAYPWQAYPVIDGELGGGSSMDVKDTTYNLNFDFNLTPAIKYPYAGLDLVFTDESEPNKLVDWSAYSEMEVRLKCRPANVLHLSILTYDPQVTKSLSDMESFRRSFAFITCDENWQTIRIDLSRLETAVWWLERNNINLAHREYSLEKVKAISLSTSMRSPLNTQSNVMVDGIILKGENRPLVYSLTALMLVAWFTFLGWAGYQFYLLREESDPPPETSPLSYKSLSLEPKYYREKEAVLNYMASGYSNPDMSVELAVSELGINRVKINEILRAETGLTFSSYLNKLRLTEAARLLSDSQVGVAEAAFAVGYNSLSYFNRLFKKEHGCNPSAYKGHDLEAKSAQST